MYPPAERDPAALAKDVANGVVTPDAAVRDYGADPKRWGADAAE
jgi:hypothetical protein